MIIKLTTPSVFNYKHGNPKLIKLETQKKPTDIQKVKVHR